MTETELENVRQQFSEAKQVAYKMGRNVERQVTISAIEELMADTRLSPKTILNSLLLTLKKGEH